MWCYSTGSRCLRTKRRYFFACVWPLTLILCLLEACCVWEDVLLGEENENTDKGLTSIYLCCKYGCLLMLCLFPPLLRCVHWDHKGFRPLMFSATFCFHLELNCNTFYTPFAFVLSQCVSFTSLSSYIMIQIAFCVFCKVVSYLG